MQVKKYLLNILNSLLILIVTIFILIKIDSFYNFQIQSNKIVSFSVISNKQRKTIIAKYENLPFNLEANFIKSQVGMISYWIQTRLKFNLNYELENKLVYRYAFVCNENFKCEKPNTLYITSCKNCLSIDSVFSLLKSNTMFYVDDETGYVIMLK